MPIPACYDTIVETDCQALSSDGLLREEVVALEARTALGSGTGAGERWPEFRLTVADLSQHASALIDFHTQFAPLFRTVTRDGAPCALGYLKGQLLCESRRTMSRMAVYVTETNAQALSNVIAVSPWSDEPLIATIGGKAVELLAGAPGAGDRALILEERGIPKHGTASVGVARQYCGALGNVDTCQVGVFLASSTAAGVTLIDRRLSLPQEGIDDPARCEQAGIPHEARIFRSKAALGLEMIRQAQQRGIPFDFVGMDAHDGQQPWLLTQLEGEGLEDCRRYSGRYPGLSGGTHRRRTAAPRPAGQTTFHAARPAGRGGGSPSAGARSALADTHGPRDAARDLGHPVCRCARLAHRG
jgi:hypothetical protein